MEHHNPLSRKAYRTGATIVFIYMLVLAFKLYLSKAYPPIDDTLHAELYYGYFELNRASSYVTLICLFAMLYPFLVIINYTHLNEIMSGRDPNTVPHELGHTAGWIHLDQARNYFGWTAFKWKTSKQKLDVSYQDNHFNLMWSETQLKKFHVPLNAALSLSSVQLGLMYSNYNAGKLNQQSNFEWKWGPGGPEYRKPHLKYDEN